MKPGPSELYSSFSWFQLGEPPRVNITWYTGWSFTGKKGTTEKGKVNSIFPEEAWKSFEPFQSPSTLAAGSDRTAKVSLKKNPDSELRKSKEE